MSSLAELAAMKVLSAQQNVTSVDFSVPGVYKLTIPNGVKQIWMDVIGAGGGGGAGFAYGGAGGGGGSGSSVFQLPFKLPDGTIEIQITVGKGGTGGKAVNASFTGYIVGNTLNVTAVSSGTLAVGNVIAGNGISSGTYISTLGTGTGGVGSYIINNSQTVGSSGSPLNFVAQNTAVAFGYISNGTSGTAGTLLTLTSNTLGTPATGAYLGSSSGVVYGTTLGTLSSGTANQTNAVYNVNTSQAVGTSAAPATFFLIATAANGGNGTASKVSINGTVTNPGPNGVLSGATDLVSTAVGFGGLMGIYNNTTQRSGGTGGQNSTYTSTGGNGGTNTGNGSTGGASANTLFSVFMAGTSGAGGGGFPSTGTSATNGGTGGSSAYSYDGTGNIAGGAGAAGYPGGGAGGQILGGFNINSVSTYTGAGGSINNSVPVGAGSPGGRVGAGGGGGTGGIQPYDGGVGGDGFVRISW